MGAELGVDVALPYDVPYRFRLGVALPGASESYGVESRLRPYVAVGRAF